MDVVKNFISKYHPNRFERVDKVGTPYRPQLYADDRSYARRLYESLFAEALATQWEVTGVDVSSWQGVINWDILSTKIQFAFMRAGVGNSTLDTQVRRNLDEANRTETPVGLYWFLMPQYSYKTHAASFASFYKANKTNITPVADIETNGGHYPKSLSTWVYGFLQEFENKAGVRPMIYTSPGFWNSNMPRVSWAKDYKLYDAHWTTATMPIVPYDWNGQTFEFWQHSSKGDGKAYGVQSHYIDLDRYRWSAVEFAKNYGTEIVPPPEPTAPPKVIINTSTLNIRTVPTDSGNTPIAQTWRGKVWKTTGVAALDPRGRGYWYQVSGKNGQELWLAGWLTRKA